MIPRAALLKACSPVLALGVLLACGGRPEQKPASWRVKPAVPAGVDREEVFHHNNLGVAHLEQHHYGEAAKEFCHG